jgi:hypothetical protein
MDYPTFEAVMNATHEQLARWYRFLPTPGTTKAGAVALEHEQTIMELVMRRLRQFGGITPEISKRVGWNSNAALKSLMDWHEALHGQTG